MGYMEERQLDFKINLVVRCVFRITCFEVIPAVLYEPCNANQTSEFREQS